MSSHRRAAELFRAASRPEPDARQRLLAGLKSRSPLVRHVAAIELAKRWPADVPEASIRELLDTLARDEYFEPSPFDNDYAEATATEDDCGSLGQDIVVAFARLDCGQADFVIPRLLEFWSFDCEFYELAHAMLALAFPRSEAAVSKGGLSGVQRRVLEALVAQPTIWNGDMTWGQSLARYGLPRTLSAMRTLLGYRR